MKVAIVHDYLNEFGGAERVLEALCEIYPKAPIYTAFYREGSSAYERFKSKKIIASWAQNVPFFASFLHSPLRFLAPIIWGSFDFSDYDVVITSASWYVTKGMVKRDPSTHSVRSGLQRPVEVCYCHTPPRYLYGYPTAQNFQKFWPIKIYAAIINHYMRVYDFEAAQRVDWFIANSEEVRSRIKKFYRRDAKVIYPPVEVDKLETRNSKSKEDYFLVVSRLVGAKNVDLAIKVCTNLKLKLKVVGLGRERENLEQISGETVEFLGGVSDSELMRLYSDCRALIFPSSQEDFGIVPVEAMAAGKPVIALREGGVIETVIDGKTGILVDDLSVLAFEKAVKKFIEMEKKEKWNSTAIRKHAQKFSKGRFKREIKKFVESKLRDL